MKIPPPNPEVYRRAAELILSGANTHCCVAISKALVEILGCVTGRHWYDLYKAQFELQFGPRYVKDISRVRVMKTYPYHRAWILDSWIADYHGHPFWDKPASVKRQNIRALALLLMADICEGPNP